MITIKDHTLPSSTMGLAAEVLQCDVTAEPKPLMIAVAMEGFAQC
jgi:hypothetical protein